MGGRGILMVLLVVSFYASTFSTLLVQVNQVVVEEVVAKNETTIIPIMLVIIIK